MDRITSRTQSGQAILPIRPRRETAGPFEDPYEAAVQRLADYEDTELDPDAVKALIMAAALMKIEIDRLHHFEKLNNDGRLVVLPCNIESQVYLIHEEPRKKRQPISYRVDECDIDHFIIGGAMIPMITAVSKDNEWYELIDGTQEGHEYWLTREAAEAALAKDTNVGSKEG